MNIPAEFDDIRPYSPEELPQVFEELLADPSFQAVLTNVIRYSYRDACRTAAPVQD